MKGVFVKSKNQNLYFYNNDTGFIDLWDDILPEGVVLEEPVSREDRAISVETQIKEVTKKDVEGYLYNGRGFRQLILEISEECNLRCKYCIYSDAYNQIRSHGDIQMSLNTAIRAIDMYFTEFIEISKRNPVRTPAVSFYGGEPLLNFDLIKKTIRYINEHYSDYNTRYNITTNGLMLKGKIAQYLVENDFSIAVSIDGDKENHDRNRVTIAGDGSFDIVYGNLVEFRKLYPDHYKICINMCTDYASSVPRMVEYINREDIVVSNFTLVSGQETNYYDKFTREDELEYRRGFKQVKDEFYRLLRSGEKIDEMMEGQMAVFGRLHINFLLRSVKGQCGNGIINHTSSCVPGEKLYVSSAGIVHMCERINPNFPIGNVNDGLDYDKILKYINDYNSTFQSCNECPFTRLCTVCFAQATADDEWLFSEKRCHSVVAEGIQMIKDHIDIMEDNPKELKKICGNHFNRINNVAGESI